MNFCFRVDAGNKIGMGHLTESICLADSLRSRTNGEIVFLVNRFAPALDTIKRSGYAYHIVREGLDAQENAEIVLDWIRKNDVQVVIVDLLNVENTYLQKLKNSAAKLVVILDDAEHRQVVGDLVINFNITQDEKFYLVLPPSGTNYLIGPKYMLLPEELHEIWKKEKTLPETCGTIFVNQGGGDPYGLTMKIIKELERLNLKQKVIVVIGPAMLLQHRKEITNLKPQLKNSYQFEWDVTQKKMYQLMLEGDLAITAAGNTLYELAVFGIPSIAVCHHERHNKVASKFEERMAVVNLGVGSDLPDNVIAGEVEQLLLAKERRSSLSHNIKKIVDGLGSKRIAEYILEMCS